KRLADVPAPVAWSPQRPTAHPLLQRQQCPLALEATAIAGEVAGRTDHPVAWHHDGQRVAAVGQSDRPRSPGTAESLRDLTVASGLAVGDPQQLAPHLE